MKYNPIENVKLYLGLKVSSLWMLVVGVKIAGVKILMPWTNFLYKFFPEYEYEYEDGTPMPEPDKMQEQIAKIVKQVVVSVCFTAGNYMYQKHMVKQRQVEIENWIKNSAPKLHIRQLAQIRMIQERAQLH